MSISKDDLSSTFERVLATLDKELEIDPKSIVRLTNKCIMLYQMGKYNESITWCDKALEIYPMNAKLLRYKGHALDNLGRYEDAIACYDEALETIPRYAKVLISKGIALGKINKYDEAIACFDKILVINQNMLTHYTTRASYLTRLVSKKTSRNF